MIKVRTNWSVYNKKHKILFFKTQIPESCLWFAGPEVIKLFSISTEHEISTAHKTTIPTNKEVSCFLSLSGLVFIILINVKMPTIVGILTYISRIDFNKYQQIKRFLAS